MTKINSTTCIISLIAIIAFIVGDPFPGAAEVKKGSCTINAAGSVTPLSGTWHFRYGDNPEWKEEIFSPGQWQKAPVPGWITPPKGKKIPGFFWYRLHVHVDKNSLRDRPLFISLPRFFHASEIYFNGKLIGARGKLPLKKKSFSWGVGGIYRIIMPENIHFDKPNVLAVRVYGGYRLFAGSLYSYGFAGPYDYRKSFYWINNLMNLFLGGILLLMAFRACVAYRRSKEPAGLRLGIFSLFLGLFFLVVWMPDNIEGDTRFLHSLQVTLLLGVLALMPPLSRGLINFSENGLRLIRWFMLFSGILGVIVLTTRYFPLVNSLLYACLGIILLLSFLAGILALVKSIRRVKNLIPFAAGGLIITAAMLVDLWRATGAVTGSGAYAVRLVTPLAAVLCIMFIYLKTSPPKENKKKTAPGRSQLTGIDTVSLEETIQRMMKEVKIYRRDTLTLHSLAEELDITSHQLSEFLNRFRQQNFNIFINSYRIAEAKDILLKEPEASIISIAYRVGFNSPSTFYDAFKKETGIKPGEFRKIKP